VFPDRIKAVQAQLGHTSVSFTLDRYGHLYPEADLELRDRLEALAGEPHASGSFARLSDAHAITCLVWPSSL
jgi:hypothetical protein